MVARHSTLTAHARTAHTHTVQITENTKRNSVLPTQDEVYQSDLGKGSLSLNYSGLF